MIFFCDLAAAFGDDTRRTATVDVVVERDGERCARNVRSCSYVQ